MIINKIRSMYTHERFVILLLGILAVAVSFLQTWHDVTHVPSGFVYPLVHNYPEDYFYYLHLMAQGAAGHITATSWMNPESFSPRFVNPFFLFLGLCSKVLSVSLPHMYTLSRGLGGIFLYAVCVRLVRIIFPESRRLRIGALVLVVFGGVFAQRGPDGWEVPYLVRYWTELDPLVRFSFIPHHLWSKIFLVASYTVILSGKAGLSKHILVAVLAILSGFSSPVVFSTALPTVAGFMVLETVYHSLKNKRLTLSSGTVLGFTFCLSAFLVSVYHYVLMHDVFPWSSYNNWEKQNVFAVTPMQYVSILGPMGIAALFAIPGLLRKTAGRLILVWGLSGWILLFIVGKFVPLGTNRFLSGYQFIPLALAAALGIEAASTFINKYIHSSLFRYSVIPLFSYSVIIAVSLPAYLASMKLHEWYWANDCRKWEICIPRPLYEGLDWLSAKEKVPGSVVVLARYGMSGPVAGLTGQKVIAAHNVITYDVQSKKAEIDTFFSYGDPSSARNILDKYGISYVFSETWGDNPTFMTQLGLTQVFSNTHVRIYERGN